MVGLLTDVAETSRPDGLGTRWSAPPSVLWIPVLAASLALGSGLRGGAEEMLYLAAAADFAADAVVLVGPGDSTDAA